MKIEIFPRYTLVLRRKWYFRIVADNGQIIAHSEAYSRRIDALTTARSLREELSKADLIY